MYVLKYFCVFFSFIGNNEHCENSDDKVFIEAKIRFEREITWEHLDINVTARNLKDIVPKNVTTWERFQLYIYEINIPVLKNEYITDIKNLTKIVLWSGNISEIEPGALKNLPQLEELRFSYNKLSEIKTSTFADLTVSDLDLNHNSITVLQPGAFQQLPNLKVLDLSHNRIGTLPSDLFNGTFNIEKLNFDENRLIEIEPETFKNLVHLKLLNLDSNKLTYDCSIPNLPELQELLLSNNSISKLDSVCFKHLPRLRVIFLKYNQLREIPEGILNYTKIEELYLEFNQISVIAPNAFDIPTLQTLAISDNKLKVWNRRWVLFIPKIRHLFVGRNEIEEIPDEVVNYDIQILDFSRNQIKTISVDAFRNLKYIRYLWLNGNKIENWDGNLLKNVTIYQIDLSNNKLQCVDGNLWEAFAYAKRVKLTDNPWRPDCRSKVDRFQQHHL